MALFKPGQSGNPNGRPSESKAGLQRLGAGKLKKLLRGLEGYVDESILTAATIMQTETASEATRLKAAAMMLEKYLQVHEKYYEFENAKQAAEASVQQPEDAGAAEDSTPDEPRLRLHAN